MKLPANWRRIRVDEAGEVKSGRQRSVHITKGELRPYLRVANVFDGYIDSSNVLQMPFTNTEYKIFRLQQGDILLNEGQSLNLVGRSAIYKGEPQNCCFQNTLIRFRPYPQTNTKFAQHLFEYLQKTGVFAAIGAQTTSIAHLGVERFASLKVVFPPLSEQKKIAEILSTWDTQLRQVEQLIAAKTRFKAALMQQLLTGKRRFREFESQPWKSRRLSDFFKKKSERNSNGQVTEVLSCTKKGIVRQSERFSKRLASLDVSRYQIVRESDLVFDPMLLWDASIGFVKGISEGIVSPAYSTFEFIGERAWLPYFDVLIRSHAMRERYKMVSQGTNTRRQKAPAAAFLMTPIPFPPTGYEKERILAVFQTLDQEIQLLQAQLRAIKEQKRGLMQQLLSGEVRVEVSI